MSRYFMGIDVGTTGGRACIFDDAGSLVGQAYHEYPCHYPHSKWVEQYAGELLPVLYKVCREAVAKSGLKASQVESIAFSMQGPVLCLLDENFELLTPLVGWQDARGFSYLQEAKEKLGDLHEYYELSGGRLSATSPLAKLLWLKNELPEAWTKAVYISTAMEYFCKKFGSDEFVTEVTSASRTKMLDIRSGCFSAEIIENMGADLDKFAKLVSPGTKIGTVNAKVAELTGLAEGTAVVMGVMDQNASTLGMGMLVPGQVGFTLGTAGVVTAITKEPIYHVEAPLLVKSNAALGNYTVEGFSLASASAYRWYRDTLCTTETDAGKRLGLDAYDIINQLARKSKPGANGVTFLNCLHGASGVLNDFNAKGMFSGLTFSTTKADLTRAVLEGIVYEAKTMTEAIEDMGVEVKELRLSGGGTKSRTWCQIQADIFGVPAILLQCSELSALGAAMLAAVGAGAFENIADAVEKCVHIKEKYIPNESNKEAYQVAFEYYKKCFVTMKNGEAW